MFVCFLLLYQVHCEGSSHLIKKKIWWAVSFSGFMDVLLMLFGISSYVLGMIFRVDHRNTPGPIPADGTLL